MNFAPPTDVVNNRRITFKSRRAHQQARQMRSIEKCCAARMEKDTTTLTTRLRGLFVNGSSAHDYHCNICVIKLLSSTSASPDAVILFSTNPFSGKHFYITFALGADLERVIATSVHRSFMKKRDFC